MVELLDQLAGLLRDTLDSPWVWLLLFAIAGLDAVLPFMPSETSVVLVAVLVGPDPARLALLVTVATVGALAGDCLSHWFGRRAGPRLLAWLHRGERGRQRYEWARAKVIRHDAALIIAARYLPGGRVASGLATGSLRVRWSRFLCLDALGSGAWAAYCVLVGRLGGASFAEEPGKGVLLSFGIALLAVALIATGLRIRANARVDPTISVPSPRAEPPGLAPSEKVPH